MEEKILHLILEQSEKSLEGQYTYEKLYDNVKIAIEQWRRGDISHGKLVETWKGSMLLCLSGKIPNPLAVSRWTNVVSEKVPDDGQSVLVQYRGGAMDVCKIMEVYGKRRFIANSVDMTEHVVGWQPLPEIYII